MTEKKTEGTEPVKQGSIKSIDPIRNSAKPHLLKSHEAKPPNGLALPERQNSLKTSNGVEDKDKILISKNTWLIIGLLITIFNPLPAGLIFGLALWKEKKTVKEGKRLVILSLFWGAISLSLALKYWAI